MGICAPVVLAKRSVQRATASAPTSAAVTSAIPGGASLPSSEESPEPPDPSESPDPGLESLVDRDLVHRAVAGLDARDRAILLLHYEHDMTVAAIAHTIGVPVGTVKVKLQRIRSKLRGHLAP